MNYEPFTSIDNPTLGTLSTLAHFSLSRPSTNVEDSLQINLFMQNKPNSLNVQINVNIYYIKNYQNFIPLAGYKNKPNSNPIKPNLQKAKMNVNLYVIEDYRKKDDFVVRINKPNFQNAKNERKLNFNKGLQKKRLFSTPKNKPNSNPISKLVLSEVEWANFKPCPELAEALSAAEGAVEWANFLLDPNIKELIVIFYNQEQSQNIIILKGY